MPIVNWQAYSAEEQRPGFTERIKRGIMEKTTIRSGTTVGDCAMEKRTVKELLVVASMLFGMFFGAGNLIFPASMGQMAGRNLWLK